MFCLGQPQAVGTPRAGGASKTAAAPRGFVPIRSALAGGIAGSFTNSFLHPLDTAKVLRQRNPTQYRSTISALLSTAPSRLYFGFVPAAVGAFPSSALYFGTYETVKRKLSGNPNPEARRIPPEL